MSGTTEWRVIEDGASDAPTNMAIDEAVSKEIRDGRSPPTIRIYRWEPSAVSVGYFGSVDDEVDTEACREDGIEFVRRRTGGGAVFHDSEGEVTYSIAAPVERFSDDITESYRSICGDVIEGLGSLGIEVEFEPVNDIVVDGRKISGSAQTRREGVLLQHGTVLHSVNPRKMFRYLQPDVDKISDKHVDSVYDRVTSVSRRVDVSVEETYEAVKSGLSSRRETYEGTLTDEEESLAEETAEDRYRSEDWNLMR